MAIAKNNFLIAFKEDIFQRLLADEGLADIPIIKEDEHTLDAQIDTMIKTMKKRTNKRGAVIAVGASAVTGLDSQETPQPLMEMAVAITVVESVRQNASATGTGWNAGEITARISQVLHMTHIDGLATGLRLSDSTPIVELDMPENTRGFRVVFQANSACFDIIANVAPVVISIVTGTATLTCSTAGATIYYTLDDTYPGSGNSAAVVYSAPVAVGSDVAIRASAEKTSFNPPRQITREVG